MDSQTAPSGGSASDDFTTQGRTHGKRRAAALGQALRQTLPYDSVLVVEFGLYTILPLPILCGIYYNNGGSEGSIVLRNSLGDGGVGCLNNGRVRTE